MKSKLPRYVYVLALAVSFFGSLTSLPAQLAVTDGLQLWLRADAGVTVDANNGVLEWADQSGNANNAVQGVDVQAPKLITGALNNLPVLRFDGTDDYLDVADSDSLSGTGDMSTFFVVKFDDFATFRAVWGKTAGTGGNIPAPTDIYAVPGSGVLRVYRGAGGPNDLSATDTAQGLQANTYLFLGFTVAGDTLTHYQNNQENGRGPATLLTADGDTALKIGTRTDFVTRLKGDLAELLIYNKALDATDRAAVFTYLQTKYNLAPTASLVSVPAGPNVTVGDIITLNATANDPDGGTITRVDFLVNGSLIGSATAPPFSLRVRIESAGTAQFTARATDNLLGVGNSSPVTLTSSPSGPTTLPVTDNLQLWLRADEGLSLGNGDTVVGWADQSGNANNAAQLDESLAPLLVNNSLNGKPVLLFDGVDDYLEIPDADSISNTGDITTLYVVRFSDFATYRGVWAKTTVNLPASTDFYALPGSGICRLYRGNGTLTGIQPFDSARPYPAGSYILGGFGQEGTTVSHYLNGQLNGVGTITAPLADLDNPLRIGLRADLVTKFKGEMAEVLIYDRALSTAERRAVERHLLEKYGLPLVSSANTPPTVAITGPIGQVLTAPGSFTVTATAADADGSIASVQFFVNGALLAADTSAPFQAPLLLSFGGKVTLTAVATDNFGAVTTSAAVDVCVQGPGAPAGLVGYWPLDGNGTATVGANGDLVNGPVASDDRNGQPGGALAFDGTQMQRVEIPGGGGLNGATSGTISLWARWTGLQDTGFGGTAGAVLGRQANGQFSDNIISLASADPDSATLQFRLNNAGAVTVPGINVVGNNNWHHIAVTFSDTASELFLDGLSEGTGGGGVLHNSANIPLAIGGWIGDGGSYATGSIDDVAIWNRVLSADEVSALAQQTRTPLNLLVSPDCLSIVRAGTKATIRWGSGTVLQEATDVFGPWADVVGASPLEVNLLGPAKFYRLRN